jgi:hypothetical protein
MLLWVFKIMAIINVNLRVFKVDITVVIFIWEDNSYIRLYTSTIIDTSSVLIIQLYLIILINWYFSVKWGLIWEQILLVLRNPLYILVMIKLILIRRLSLVVCKVLRDRTSSSNVAISIRLALWVIHLWAAHLVESLTCLLIWRLDYQF